MAAPDRVLLANARVLTCSGDPTERPIDGDVLLEGETIAGVFAGRAPIEPGSARVVDLAGATLIPGLCDAHTHISWPLDFVFDHPAVAAMPDDDHALEQVAVVRTYLHCGYTLLISGGALKPRSDVIMQRAIDKGLIEGPRMWPGGNMLTEVGGVGSPTLTEIRDAEHMRRVVGEECAAGVKAIKLMVSGDGIVPGYPSQMVHMDDAMVAAAVDEAAKHGAFVTAHSRGSESTRMAVRNGVRIVHHATYLDDDAIAELTAARDDVWVCPGLHYLRQTVEGRAADWGMTRERVDAALYPEELQASIDSLRKLHANGVRIVSGGDFGHQWTQHGTYAAELLAYVELVGLSPLEALITATANGGPIVGLPVGTIAEGQLADLVVLDGDPTADLRILLDPARVGPVVKGGVPASMASWGIVDDWARSRSGV